MILSNWSIDTSHQQVNFISFLTDYEIKLSYSCLDIVKQNVKAYISQPPPERPVFVTAEKNLAPPQANV